MIDELNFGTYKSLIENIKNGIYKDSIIYAIIGTREPDRIQKDVAYNLGVRFARKGIINITGGAIGLDYFGTCGCIDNGGKVIWILPKYEDRILVTKGNYDYMVECIKDGLNLDIIVMDYVQELSLKQQYLNRNEIILDISIKTFLPMYYDEFKIKYTGVYRQIKNRITNKKDNASKYVFLHDIIKMLNGDE